MLVLNWGWDKIVQDFTDSILKCIFLNENIWISIKIFKNIVPFGPIVNKSALFQIIIWCQTGDKPLVKSMITYFFNPISVG